MERIGVFCSAHDGLPTAVVEATRQLGTWIGEQRLTLVYGGVSKGLMEILAQTVKQNGGRVMGIIPDRMAQQGLTSSLVDIEFPVVDLSDRKATMLREADAFVALPGGIGTLDEIFSVMAAALVNEHHKPMILLNINGYWDDLITMLSSYERQGYLYPGSCQALIVPRSVEELVKYFGE